MNGYGPLNAAIVDDGWLRHDVERKARKARERLSRGGDCYLVGLVVDEAISSTGHHLQTTLLGAAICECITPPDNHRTYRPVPVAASAAYEHARRQGRDGLLELALFDPRMHNTFGHPVGLYFERVCAYVAGVVALYYTDALQFVPNPFASTPIEAVAARFPAQFDPVQRA